MTAEVNLSRMERRKLEFRDRITNAALKLFGEQGVADTSIASIIKEADIAHKTFFNHFPSKDHLLQHIVSSFADHAYAVFREAFKNTADPKKRIEYCLINIAEVLEPLNPKYKELMNFYLISGVGPGNIRAAQKDQFIKMINEILDEAEQQGMLRPDFEREVLTEIIVDICVATLLSWSVEQRFPLLKKMQRAVSFINTTVFI